MVSLYQHKGNMGKIIPPPAEQIKFLIGVAVKKIADNNKSCGFKILDNSKQPLHILLEYLLRNGNAIFTEMTGFTDVKVRSYQGPLFLPIHYSFPGKPKSLSVPMMNLHKKQAKIRLNFRKQAGINFKNDQCYAPFSFMILLTGI